MKSVFARQSNVDLVADKLEKVGKAEDLIVLLQWSSGISFQRYYEGHTPWVTVPDLDDHRVHRYDILRQLFERERPIDDVFVKIDQVLAAGGVVYLVGGFRALPLSQLRYPKPAPHPIHRYFKGLYLGVWKDLVRGFLNARARAVKKQTPDIEVKVEPHEMLPVYAFRGYRLRLE